MAKVKKVTELPGLHQTYDLEVDHPDHQFYLQNGVLTSNSHAVSYAFDSYFCAWLFKYYPKEWLCAWLESAEGDPVKKTAAISVVKSFGYKIHDVDINLSQRNWTVTNDNEILPSFKSAKGIGDAAINEILSNRPYTSLQSLLWNQYGKWRHSKFNKRNLDVLIKLEAFKSMNIVGPDEDIKNYKQLHYIVIENADLLKKKGPEILPKLIEESAEIEDWTPQEKMDFLKEFAGVISVKHIVDDDVKEQLRAGGVPSINEFLNDPDYDDGDVSLVWFILENAQKKNTKTGKEYMLFTVIDDLATQQRVFVWGAKHSFIYDLNKLYICEIKKGDFISTTAWKVKKADI